MDEGSTEQSKTEVNTLLQTSSASVQHKTPSRLKNVLAFAVCCFLNLVLSCAFSILGPFFPIEAAQKGVSSTLIGSIVSASPFCVVILSPFFGYYGSSIGVRFMLLISTLVLGLSFSLFGLVSKIGTAMFFTSSYALSTALYPKNIGLVMGLLEVAAGMGFAIGPAVGSGLYELGGFLLPFVVIGACPLFLLVPLYIFLPDSDIPVQRLSSRAVCTLLRSFPMLCIALCNVLALAALGFFTSTFSPFLVNKLHISLPHVGLVFLAGPALYMLAALVAGPLSDKFVSWFPAHFTFTYYVFQGTRPFIICGLFICAAGYFLVGPADFIASPRLWLTIVSFTAIGFGAALTFVPAYADLLNIAKSLDTGYNLESLTTVVSGIISSALSCGDMLGPFVGGVLTDYLDFQTSAVIFGEILLAQGLLVLLLTLVERRVST
ncbi:hypothetical protein EMCRGX_G024964 [Ephydatia muelleri]